MTNREIQELVERLPQPNPFTRWVVREQARRRLREMINPGKMALSRPDFGWCLVKSYADEQLPLPDFVSQTALLGANRYLLQPGQLDLSVVLAHMLSLPTSRAKSELLQALVVCEDITPEEIASICGYDVEVIRYHDALFWNVLERKQELPYIRRLYTQSGAGDRLCHSDAQDYSGDLLLLAYGSRNVDLVLAKAGVSHPSRKKLSPDTLYKQIQNKRLRSAFTGLAMRAVSDDDNPALKAALRIVRKSKSEKTLGKEQIPQITVVESIKLYLDKMREIGADCNSDENW